MGFLFLAPEGLVFFEMEAGTGRVVLGLAEGEDDVGGTLDAATSYLDRLKLVKTFLTVLHKGTSINRNCL